MQTIKCDRCDSTFSISSTQAASTPTIRVLGFSGRDLGGRLLPDIWEAHDFCSRKCLVAWLDHQLENEPLSKFHVKK